MWFSLAIPMVDGHYRRGSTRSPTGSRRWFISTPIPDDGQSLFDLNIPKNTQMFIDRAPPRAGFRAAPPAASSA